MTSQNTIKLSHKIIAIILSCTVLICALLPSLHVDASAGLAATIIGGAIIAFLSAVGIKLTVNDISPAQLGDFIYGKVIQYCQSIGTNISNWIDVNQIIMYSGWLKLTSTIKEKFSDFADWFVDTLTITTDTTIYDNTIATVDINGQPYKINIVTDNNPFPDLQYIADNYITILNIQGDYELNAYNISGTQFNKLKIYYSNSSGHWMTTDKYYNDTFISSTGITAQLISVAQYYNHTAIYFDPVLHLLRIYYIDYKTSGSPRGTRISFNRVENCQLLYNTSGPTIASTANPDIPITNIDESMYIGITGQYDIPASNIEFGTKVLNLASTNTLLTTDTISASDADVGNLPSPETPSFPILAFNDVWKYVRYLFQQAAEFFGFIGDVISCLPQEIIWCIYGAGILLIFGGVVSKLLI